MAGLLKLGDPAASVRAVRAYQILPEAIVPLVGHALPVVEVLVGICLLAGLVVRPAAMVSVVLFTAFVIGVSSAWARGLQIDCGCFGGGGYGGTQAAEQYPWEIARDVGLLLLSAWLVLRPRSPWSVDNQLIPHAVPSSAEKEERGVEEGVQSDRAG